MFQLKTLLALFLSISTLLPLLSQAQDPHSALVARQVLNDAVAASALDSTISKTHRSIYSLGRVGLWTGTSAVTIIALVAVWLQATRSRRAREGAASDEASRELLNASMQEISEDYLPSFSASHGGDMSSRAVSRSTLGQSFRSAPHVRMR